jgi:hypothetical protein
MQVLQTHHLLAFLSLFGPGPEDVPASWVNFCRNQISHRREGGKTGPGWENDSISHLLVLEGILNPRLQKDHWLSLEGARGLVLGHALVSLQ